MSATHYDTGARRQRLDANGNPIARLERWKSACGRFMFDEGQFVPASVRATCDTCRMVAAVHAAREAAE